MTQPAHSAQAHLLLASEPSEPVFKCTPSQATSGFNSSSSFMLRTKELLEAFNCQDGVPQASLPPPTLAAALPPPALAAALGAPQQAPLASAPPALASIEEQEAQLEQEINSWHSALSACRKTGSTAESMTAVLGIAPSSSSPSELQASGSSGANSSNVLMRAYQSTVSGATSSSNQPAVL